MLLFFFQQLSLGAKIVSLSQARIHHNTLVFKFYEYLIDKGKVVTLKTLLIVFVKGNANWDESNFILIKQTIVFYIKKITFLISAKIFFFPGKNLIDE